jgi:excisionase family DNA binding protein
MLRDLVVERQKVAERLAALDAEITLCLAEQQRPRPTEEHLLTADQAAKRLGISRVFLYEKARLGEVRSIRIGRAVRFRPEDLDAYTRRKSEDLP